MAPPPKMGTLSVTSTSLVVLRIELDAIGVVGGTRSAGALHNAIGIGPGNGGESGNQVASP